MRWEGRALAVVLLVAQLLVPSRASAAAVPFLWLPLDGEPTIVYYVDDAWTIRNGLPTYENITLGQPYKHSGTDYRAPKGTPIYAAAKGTVITAADGFPDECAKRASDNGGFGNTVWIKHDNGYITLYLHMEPGSVNEFVKVGGVVQAGQQIGRVSNTGNTFGGACGGFHLHFEVWDSNLRVTNPYNTDTGYLFTQTPPVKASGSPPAPTPSAPPAPAAAPCTNLPLATSQVYLPNVTKTLGGPDGWVTPFIAQNVGTSPTALELSFYRFSDGSLVTCRRVAVVAAGTSFADVPNSDADLPGGGQFSVVIRSYGAPIVSVVNEHQQIGRAREEALSYVGLAGGATRVSVPLVAKNAKGFVTTVVVQNLGAVRATVNATFTEIGGAGSATIARTIAPGAAAFIDPRVEASLAEGSEYAAVLRSDQAIGVIANAHADLDPAAPPKAYSFNGAATSFGPVYLPYVARNTDDIGRTSRLVVQNAGAIGAAPTITLTPLAGGAAFVISGALLSPGTAVAYDLAAVAGLRDGEYSAVVNGGEFAVLDAILSPATAMGTTGIDRPSARVYLPNVTRTLGGPAGWTTPIRLQFVSANGATLRWYRLSDGALMFTQSVQGTPGSAIAIDEQALPQLADDTQYSVVAEGAGGTIAAIVTELKPGAGDGAMIYEGFAGN